MTTDFEAERYAQDNFRSMVGETGPYPNDPQHPDPGFDVDAPKKGGESCKAPTPVRAVAQRPNQDQG